MKFEQIRKMTKNKPYERHIVSRYYAVECGLEEDDPEVRRREEGGEGRGGEGRREGGGRGRQVTEEEGGEEEGGEGRQEVERD